jgi:hypothetical protein
MKLVHSSFIPADLMIILLITISMVEVFNVNEIVECLDI